MWMKTVAKRGLVVGMLSLVLAASYGCEQQEPLCAAGRGAFVVQYRHVGGPPECAERKGEKIGISTYNPRGADGRPSYQQASIAIQAESLGVLVDNAEAAGLRDPDPNHHPYAIGTFATANPVDDFCVVPTLAPAVQVLPAVEEDPDLQISAQPATTVSYDWRNVRVYVTASAYGSQIAAELTLTKDGVACDYQVIGMWPWVDCGSPAPDNPEAMVPDDAACSPEPDESAGRPVGSGINPDFPTRCDPDLLACVLTKDTIPALR